jgi:hypothetical protein
MHVSAFLSTNILSLTGQQASSNLTGFRNLLGCPLDCFVISFLAMTLCRLVFVIANCEAGSNRVYELGAANPENYLPFFHCLFFWLASSLRSSQ